MNRADYDPEERAFVREIESVLDSNRAPAGSCYPPDRLMAARAGVAFEEAADVLRHLEICPICRQLTQDLDDYQFPGASLEEDRRIRARWQKSRTQWQVLDWWKLGVAAILILAVAAAVLSRNRRQDVAKAPPEPSAQATRTSSAALPLSKAAIKIPAASVLVFRGNSAGAAIYLKDLAAALGPYRQDNYTEAAKVLEVLSRKYPGAADPLFYLGVSQLFLSQSDAAIASLQAARIRSGETLHDDIAWYLALALSRGGRIPDARLELDRLCARDGQYKKQACVAADSLAPR
jgi:tetratricopeptide (TPR) repeat protein